MSAFCDRNQGYRLRTRCGIYRIALLALFILPTAASIAGAPPNAASQQQQPPPAGNPKSAAPAPLVKTYFCDGMWRLGAPDAKNVLESKTGGNDSEYLAMMKLLEKQQYSALLTKCTANIKSTPDWLTPRLFCGIAYVELGQNSKAEPLLTEFQKKAGPDYDVPDCHNMLVILRRALNK